MNAKPSIDDDMQARIARVPSAWGHELPSRHRFSAQIVGSMGAIKWGRVIAALGSAVIRRDRGSAKVTRRHNSALVAVLACASLLAVSHYAAARTTHGGKGSSVATAKAAGKTAKSTGKKAAARKSKDDKSASKSAVPQIPLASGPTPETSQAEIARVKSAIEALRHGGASKATEVAVTISDPGRASSSNGSFCAAITAARRASASSP